MLRVLSTHQPQIEHGGGADATAIKWIHLSNNSLYILCASAVKSPRSVKCQYCSAENPSMFEIVHCLVDLLEFVTARDEFIEF